MTVNKCCSYFNPWAWKCGRAKSVNESAVMKTQMQQKPVEVFFKILQGMTVNGRAHKRLNRYLTKEKTNERLNSVYRALSPNYKDEFTFKKLECVADAATSPTGQRQLNCTQEQWVEKILSQVLRDRLILSLQVIVDEKMLSKESIEYRIYVWMRSFKGKVEEEEIEFFKKCLKLHVFTPNGAGYILEDSYCRAFSKLLMFDGRIEGFKQGEMIRLLRSETKGDIYQQAVAVLNKKERSQKVDRDFKGN